MATDERRKPLCFPALSMCICVHLWLMLSLPLLCFASNDHFFAGAAARAAHPGALLLRVALAPLALVVAPLDLAALVPAVLVTAIAALALALAGGLRLGELGRLLLRLHLLDHLLHLLLGASHLLA